MTRTVLGATTEGLRRELKELRRMVMDLKRDQTWQYDEDTSKALAVIDMGDGPVPTGFSKGHVGVGATLIAVTGLLSVAGSTGTDAEVTRNGSAVGTITIPASAKTATASLVASFGPADVWQMRVTSAGTGAGGLSYFGDFT